jgi:site-specific DNA-methyltransferase (adenine-specific)
MPQQLLLHQPVVEGANPFPAKTFDIIYADPPWQYSDKKKNRGGAERHYQTQTDYWIQTLPVSQIAADDALLFMWATFPKLDVAIATMNAWGFEYKTAAFVWAKTNKKSGTYFFGMGSHTRANAEPCLLGVRGNGIKRISASVRQICDAPIGDHSAKPPEIRDRIVELIGDRPRIELFARDKVSGWDCWGDQID